MQIILELLFDEVTPNFQNECAKDSHPPNEQADCKELFGGVEKPPDKGLLDAGINLFAHFNFSLGAVQFRIAQWCGAGKSRLGFEIFVIKGALNSSSNFDWVSRF